MIKFGVAFFTGGSNFQEVTAKAYGYQGSLQIGIPRNLRARRPDGSSIALWKVAFVLEYGNPYNTMPGGARAPIPPRPAVNMMWTRNGDSYLRALRNYVYMDAKGSFPLQQGLSRLNDKIKRDMRAEYEAWRSPANTQFTIEHKRVRTGMNDPLMDSGKLSRSWEGAWFPDPASGTAKRAFREAVKADRAMRAAQRASKP